MCSAPQRRRAGVARVSRVRRTRLISSAAARPSTAAELLNKKYKSRLEGWKWVSGTIPISGGFGRGGRRFFFQIRICSRRGRSLSKYNGLKLNRGPRWRGRREE
ncbi:hypothetical protein EVAR_55298_1 [Eumeta japonica]|uniref:Uncharacterized protein n=1 Tax=Eumeta variegata TaxID=151549 RepID=A0A4C1ZIS3_EUMVA|nr:hypothetical protein EVAR_55298_1 [Eumeta japonica]